MRGAVLLLGAFGCVAGGGPVVGCPIGDGRCFVGAEAGAGNVFVQGSIGVQSNPGVSYGRIDATLDIAGLSNGRSPAVVPGGRIGVGLSSANHVAVFETGAHVGVLLRSNGVGRRCSDLVPVALLGVDLRYLDKRWFVAFAPRIELHRPICEH